MMRYHSYESQVARPGAEDPKEAIVLVQMMRARHQVMVLGLGSREKTQETLCR